MRIQGTRIVNLQINTQPASTLTTSNLVLYLDAGNPASYSGSGNIWTDTIGGMPFTLHGTPTYNSANGGYIQFNPTNSDYAYSAYCLPTLDAWTIEVWHYYDGTNSVGLPCLFTETYNGGDINLTLGAANGPYDCLQTAFYSTSNGGWQSTSAGYSLTPNAWYHIAGTYDGTNLKLYVNNALVETAAGAGSHATGNQGYRLMTRWDNPEYWGGRLGIVRIYDRALLDTEITDNFDYNHTRFGL